MLRFALALVLGAACVTAVPAAPEAKANIEKAVAVHLDAAKKVDWARYVKTLHPDSVKAFRDDLVPLVKAAKKQPAVQQTAVIDLFDGGESLDRILAWEPAEFLVRFLKGMVGKSPIKEHLSGRDYRVVGSVREGAEAHVVVRIRSKMMKVDITRLEVISVRQSGKEWKVILPAEMRLLAETIKLSQPDAVHSTTRTVEQVPDPAS